MDLLKEISKKNYEIEKSKNGAINFQNLKEKYNGNGTFVGKYLHTIYPSLNKSLALKLEAELSVKIHDDLLKILALYNGFNLFSDSFNLYGFGKVLVNGSYQTTRDPLNPLPFDLLTENNGKINEAKIKIGSVCEDSLFFDNTNGKVCRMDKKSKLIESWSTISDCITSIYQRLDKCYDNIGFSKEPIVMGNLVFNKTRNI